MLPSNHNPVLKIPKMLSPSLSLRMLLGSSNVARLLRQPLQRMVKLTIGVQAPAIRKLVCGLFTSPEPVMPPLLSVPQEHLRQTSQRRVARPLHEVTRAKTNSRHILPKSLPTTTPSETIPPTSSRRSWTSTNEKSACGLVSAGQSLSA